MKKEKERESERKPVSFRRGSLMLLQTLSEPLEVSKMAFKKLERKCQSDGGRDKRNEKERTWVRDNTQLPPSDTSFRKWHRETDQKHRSPLSIGVYICAAKVSVNRKQSELLLPTILSRDESISSVWITSGKNKFVQKEFDTIICIITTIIIEQINKRNIRIHNLIRTNNSRMNITFANYKTTANKPFLDCRF